jgi:hypothetical protein
MDLGLTVDMGASSNLYSNERINVCACQKEKKRSIDLLKVADSNWLVSRFTIINNHLEYFRLTMLVVNNLFV